MKKNKFVKFVAAFALFTTGVALAQQVFILPLSLPKLVQDCAVPYGDFDIQAIEHFCKKACEARNLAYDSWMGPPHCYTKQDGTVMLSVTCYCKAR